MVYMSLEGVKQLFNGREVVSCVWGCCINFIYAFICGIYSDRGSYFLKNSADCFCFVAHKEPIVAGRVFIYVPGNGRIARYLSRPKLSFAPCFL